MSAALGNLSKLNCARLHDISVLFTCLLVYLFTKKRSFISIRDLFLYCAKLHLSPLICRINKISASFLLEMMQIFRANAFAVLGAWHYAPTFVYLFIRKSPCRFRLRTARDPWRTGSWRGGSCPSTRNRRRGRGFASSPCA